ncbi:MAG: MoxR family ATPase [Planctomycetota bacterium]
MPTTPNPGTTDLGQRLLESIETVVLGKRDAIERTLTALIGGGHVLIEDVPGVGKTLLARALARSLGLPFQRLQCTADLLPADVLGAPVYDPATGSIELREGPVFTSVLIADELNRTPPRTQSALLECMAEGCVTIDGQTRNLPESFFVVATQNPTTSAGTYPLPDSQLDRFLVRVSLGYPALDDELIVVAREDGHRSLESLEPVASEQDLVVAREQVRGIRVQEDVLRYLVEFVRATRTHSEVEVGVSPRGAQALHRACRARAFLQNREYVLPDDIQELAVPVLGHRVGVDGGIDAASALIHELLQQTAAPA